MRCMRNRWLRPGMNLRGRIRPKITLSSEYTCTACPATFEKRVDLFAHVKSHGKSRFPCQQCDRAFKRKTELEVHMTRTKSSPASSARPVRLGSSASPVFGDTRNQSTSG
uniref:Gastrula zinc finger protein xFG20-1 n=1 Tax=Culex pipiens TaxID=7175 RepID=A0A8D8F0D6_CULPI